jgi:glycogen debranching enzyme
VHGERHADGAPGIEPADGGFVFEQAYRVCGAGWEPGGAWYRDVRAREEAARGLGDREDLWAAGTFATDLEPGACHEVTAAAAPFDGNLPAATEIVAAARARAAGLLASAGATDDVDAQLVLAADQFAVTTSGRPTAVAGYP